MTEHPLMDVRIERAKRTTGGEMAKIYKICSRLEWQAAVADGAFRGAGVDLEDGYIHFSCAKTVAETARKYFGGVADFVLVEVEADNLGDSLRWEPSRGGELFPHLYAALPVGRAQAIYDLSLDANGYPVLPSFLTSTAGR